MREVAVPSTSIERLADVLSPAGYEAFIRDMERARDRLSGRTLWHINSADQGGGVAELLQFVLGYLANFVDCRWLVIDGDDDFFRITKQIHHLLHAMPGDGSHPEARDRQMYERTLAANVDGPFTEIQSRDVVMLHDPQTIGLTPAVRKRTSSVLWSCHIGADEPNDDARAAWNFLMPYVRETRAQVFSRRAYIWEPISPGTTALIPPCIDACSPKNRSLDDASVGSILQKAGLLEGKSAGAGPPITHTATLLQDMETPSLAPLVVQVSRWDDLKDPLGVMRGFADHVADAHLMLAGPAQSSVDDDPEAGRVLREVRSAWEELPSLTRARIHLASLPMQDVDENALIVNALQRRADVVVQKSLAEGFGLTVAEAMWKSRPVVGSCVGGIQDQIVDGESGLLVDPDDLAAFGRAVNQLLDEPEQAARFGKVAHERVAEEFIAPRYIARSLDLIEKAAG